MKHRGTIFLALILALLAVSADGYALANAMPRQQETQIKPATGHVEFVMVRTTQLPDLASDGKTTTDAHPAKAIGALIAPHVIRTSLPTQDQSFKARRHEAYIPLRL